MEEATSSEKYVDVYGKSLTAEEAAVYYESPPIGGPDGFTRGDPINIEEDIDRVMEVTGLRESVTVRPLLPVATPEEVITVYGALRTYLKVLSQQPDEDLETIARVTRLMIAIKPQAVEASQEIARKSNGAA